MTTPDGEIPSARHSRWTIAFVAIAALVSGVVISESFHSHTDQVNSLETGSVDSQYWSRQNSEAITKLTTYFSTIETKLTKLAVRAGLNDTVVVPKSDFEIEVTPVFDGPEPALTEERRVKLLAKLKAATSTVQEHRAAVVEETGIKSPGLAAAVTASGDSADWMVQRITHKLLHPGSRLVLAFTGMSVCAAHGNFYRESYAHVIRDAIKAAFEKAGIEVVTRNQCMGGTETFPFSWCMKTFVGSDVDMVGWDFGMMEAGRDWLTDGWLYKTLSLPSQPAAMLFSGYETMEAKGKGTGVLSPYRKQLIEKLGKLKMPIYGMEVGPALHSTYTREVVNKGTPNEDINFVRKDSDPSPPLMVGTRKYDSPAGTPGQAPWHPAFKEHRYQGLIAADFFLQSLQQALLKSVDILDANKERPTAPDSWYPLDPANILNNLPGCNRKGAEDMQCEPQFECATEYEPRRGHSLTEIRASDTWKQQISPGDKQPYEANQRVGSGYLDNKMAFCGSRADGWLDLHLHHVKKGKLIVCEPTYGWDRPKNVALLGEGAEFKVEATKIGVKKSALLSKSCYEINRVLQPGGGIFSIRAKSNEKQVCVSFLMWT